MTFFKKNTQNNTSPYLILLKKPFIQKKYESITKVFAKLSFLKKNLMYSKFQKFRLKCTKFFLNNKLKKQFIKIKLELFFRKNYDIF